MERMTDIEVLEREMQCVQRKAQINCTNCGSCDLLMDDKRILAAYANAIAALRIQQEADKNRATLKEIVDLQKRYKKLFEEKRLTKKAICDLGVPFRDKYGLKDSDAIRVIRGELSLEEIEEFISSHCSPSKAAEKNEPLTWGELRQMDGQPVWIVPLDKNRDWEPQWIVYYGPHPLVRAASNPKHVLLVMSAWLAYRRPPEVTQHG